MALFAAAALAFLGGAAGATASEPPPSAREILAMVRANESYQNRNFTGRLRMSGEAGRVIVPFRLLMRGHTITYQFANPPESLVLHLGEKGSSLERTTGSGRARLDGLVRGTDITYEDLALKFLYWNNAKVVGEDSLMTRHCWVVQAVPSGRGDSQYHMVPLSVQKSGGLLKADCYSKGHLAKRFEVRNVQHAAGGYVLKTMRIQRLDAAGKDHSPTYLEINPA